MVPRIRPGLTYANVVSTVALCLAVGGGTVYAASQLGKNTVTSQTIKNGQVKTPDLANRAVTGPKIATNAVTGANIVENSLTFGCTKNGGEFQLPGGGFCAVRLAIPSKTWYQAVLQCAEDYPNGTLPTAAQVQALASTSATTMFNGPMTVWTGDIAGSTPSAWIVGVATNFVNGAGAFPLSTSNQTSDIVCVYDPASKNG